MKQKTITLENWVRVSDPCYDLNLFNMPVLEIKGGEYQVKVSVDRYQTIKSLTAIRKGYKGKKSWKYFEEIGVDGGQAGIFSYQSYRNDEVANDYVGGEFFNDYFVNSCSEKRNGDKFWAMMTDLTLENGWGTYSYGVVSRSGYGDGLYPIYITKDENRNIVGIKIEFF